MRSDGGLVFGGHRGVGVVPAPEDADALELLALKVEILLSVLPARQADLGGVHLELLFAELLVDLDLDRQSVAVPSWDIGRVESAMVLDLTMKSFSVLLRACPRWMAPFA